MALSDAELRLHCLAEALARHEGDDAALAAAARYHAFVAGETAALSPKPDGRKARARYGMTAPKRRFTELPAADDPAAVKGLPANHPAVTQARTLFPSTVVDPSPDQRVLVSGAQNRKLGDRVVKGPWRGMMLYHLTLEERATCPRSCAVYNQCYGNGMQLARRNRHGPELIARLEVELADLNARHPDGFVVRLHTLGDFYSTDYVDRWMGWISEYPALRVFGYTAHPRDSEIGRLIGIANEHLEKWWCVRFSDPAPAPMGAVTIFRKPEGPVVAEGTVCPAETGKTACCGTCGLCWSPAFRDKTIVFLAHGKETALKEALNPVITPFEPDGDLAPDEDAAWRFIAGLISTTGLSPSYAEIAAALDRPNSTVSGYVGGLVKRGLLAKTGNRCALLLHVREWPEGVKARKTAGRTDGGLTVPVRNARQLAPPSEPERVAERSGGVLEQLRAETAAKEAERPLAGPVTRRCQNPACGDLFTSRHVGEIWCPDCARHISGVRH
jgi:hypothetical protein